VEGRDERSLAAEERRANRPYRRFVGFVFATLLLVVTSGVLRGIIQRLDRLPQVETFLRPEHVDDRALRACADDFERLELKIRTVAGRSFARDPSLDSAPNWKSEAPALETDRLRIVARCRLHEASGDAVLVDLSTAGDRIESMLRSYNLLFDRHRDDGEKASVEARAALNRAQEALRSR
jgi:hypothetical protein